MTVFYLGTHLPNWLGQTQAPLFVSRRRICDRKTLPAALGKWALDSGGFSELSLFGRWTIDAPRYAGEVRRYFDEVGGLQWAAVQDWMCEPVILEKTGLDVLEHQRRTVRNTLELRDLQPDLPWAPVLQGWHIDDYLRHVDMYLEAGVDLFRAPIVGVGSVCRRQHTAEVEILIRRLTRDGLSLHGFGFKVLGLKRLQGTLASADSMAWSFDARRMQRPAFPDCTHANCANCLRYALAWRDRILAAGAPASLREAA